MWSFSRFTTIGAALRRPPERNTERSPHRYGLLAAALLCICSCTPAPKEAPPHTFDIEKKYSSGPVTMILRADRKELTIVDRLRVEIETVADKDWEVELPLLSSLLETMTVGDYGTDGPVTIKGNRQRTVRWYMLEPFLCGSHTIPPLTITFFNTAGKDPQKHTLRTEEIPITVTSLVGENREKLKDIHPITDVVSLPPAQRWWIAIVAAALVLLGTAGFVGARLLRSDASPAASVALPDPPHVIAYRRLQKLVDRGLIDEGKIKELFIELSDIVRQYIEDRFGLRAPERTTEEFLYEVSAGNKLRREETGLLKEFLNQCDLVKFAKHEPARDEIQGSFDLARAFIEKTK